MVSTTYKNYCLLFYPHVREKQGFHPENDSFGRDKIENSLQTWWNMGFEPAKKRDIQCRSPTKTVMILSSSREYKQLNWRKKQHRLGCNSDCQRTSKVSRMKWTSNRRWDKIKLGMQPIRQSTLRNWRDFRPNTGFHSTQHKPNLVKKWFRLTKKARQLPHFPTDVLNGLQISHPSKKAVRKLSFICQNSEFRNFPSPKKHKKRHTESQLEKFRSLVAGFVKGSWSWSAWSVGSAPSASAMWSWMKRIICCPQDGMLGCWDAEFLWLYGRC